MHAKDAVSLGVRERLDEAVGLAVGLGARVGHHVKLADAVLDLLGLKLLLALAHPRHLRRRVDHRRHAVVVHVHRHPGHAYSHSTHGTLVTAHQTGPTAQPSPRQSPTRTVVITIQYSYFR